MRSGCAPMTSPRRCGTPSLDGGGLEMNDVMTLLAERWAASRPLTLGNAPAGSAGPDRQFTSPDPLEAVEGVDDLLGFGAGAVVGVDVDPPDGAAGVEGDGGGHRQGDGAVGVDAGQVESEVQLGGAGLG